MGRWPVGKELALRPRMQAIALEAILRAVIGAGDERRLQRLRVLLARLARIGLVEMWVAFVWVAFTHERAAR